MKRANTTGLFQRDTAFPGVAACVELLRRRNVTGERVEMLCRHLERSAAAHAAELIAAARAEPDARVRRIVLGILAEAKLPAAGPLFEEVLKSDDIDSRSWAERGLRSLNGADSRRV